MRRTRLVLVAAGIMLLAMGFATIADAQVKGRIRYAVPAFTLDREKMSIALIEGFNQEYPDIKIDLESTPTEFDRKIVVEYAGGVAPDVVWVWGQQYWPWVAQGMLLDITDRFMAEEEIIADLWPGSTDAPRFKGVLYGGPDSRLTSHFLHYNADLYKEVGIPNPNERDPEEWTVEAFAEDCKKLTVDKNGDGINDIWGFSIPNWIGYHMPFIYPFGGELFNEDRTKCTLDMPETIAGYKFLYDLIYTYKVAPTVAQLADMGAAHQLFATGVISMYEAGPWDWGWMRNMDFDWDITYMPKGPAGRLVPNESASGAYCITNTTKNADASWEFVRWMYSVKASEITVEYGEAPWRVSVAKSEAFLKHPSGKPKSAMIAIDSMENYGKPNPYNPAWAEFMDIYHPILDELWLDKTTPEDACKRITEKANEMLVEFYEKLEEK